MGKNSLQLHTPNMWDMRDEIAPKLANHQWGLSLIIWTNVYMEKQTTNEKLFTEMFGGASIFGKMKFIGNIYHFDYAGKVNKVIAEQRLSAAETKKTFVPDEKKGYTFIDKCFAIANSTGELQFITRWDKDNQVRNYGQFYIVREGETYRKATEEETAFIESKLRPTYVSKKQTEAGVAPEKQVHTNNYHCSRIQHIGTIEELQQIWEQY